MPKGSFATPVDGGAGGVVQSASSNNSGEVRPKKSRNTTWLVVGFCLVLLSGLGAAFTAYSFTDDTQVVVAARPLKADHLVEVGDLEVVTVPARVGEIGIPGSDLEAFIGQRTTGPIGADSVVHPQQFSDDVSGNGGKVVIGISLEAGQLPQLGLREGQRVRLMMLSGDDFSTTDTESDIGEIGLADVVRVVELSGQDEYLASLRVDAEDASSIVDLGFKGRIALVLLGESQTVVVEGGESASQASEGDVPDAADVGDAENLDGDGGGEPDEVDEGEVPAEEPAVEEPPPADGEVTAAPAQGGG